MPAFALCGVLKDNELPYANKYLYQSIIDRNAFSDLLHRVIENVVRHDVATGDSQRLKDHVHSMCI